MYSGHRCAITRRNLTILNRDLGRLQQEVKHLDERLSEQEASFTQRLRESEQRIITRLEELSAEQSKRQTEIDQRQTQRVQALEDINTQHFAELQRKVNLLDEEFRNELRQASQLLRQDKVDRVSLGDMLMEMGSSLKNGDSSHLMDDLLQELSNSIE